ncbi:hypothetical protein [Brevibacillus sp. SYSU BS000544]|uniref:hypothetical protein n=1 Tax=Brevibacillus sp. SYSU BS000544 TaxID=3416443 RepID=UPI003CE536A8
MQGIVLQRKEHAGEAIITYSFYDNKFASGNLVVRKLYMAMLTSVEQRLSHIEVEYNDLMVAETLGKRAAEVLQRLGATKDNLRENRSGDTIVSRIFRSELTEDRYSYLYYFDDLARLAHYSFLEEDVTRVHFYFSQYLELQIPLAEEENFYQELTNAQVPYKLIRTK